MYVSERSFDQHVRLLVRSYRCVGIDELGDWLDGDDQDGKPPCAITFDDGWEDNYHVAFPILQRYRAPATVFLVTGAVGSVGRLGWDQVSEMERAGISFGSHTVSHPLLGECDEVRIRQELERSRNEIFSRLRSPSKWFCYPKGSYNPRVRSLASQYYRGAVTTRTGWVQRRDDPFTVHRIGVHEDVSWTTPLFAWRLALLK